MLNRQFGANYRFGFNGKEQDNEVEGKGDILDFGARIYDSRLGRWLSVDPLQSKYAQLSPYNFAANSPIKFVDYGGKDFGVEINYTEGTILIVVNVYTTTEHAYNQALSAASEINNVNATTHINGKDYTVKFQVTVKPPTVDAEKMAQKDPIGNLYKGTTKTIEESDMKEDKEGKFHGIGGTTQFGWRTQMNRLRYSFVGGTDDLGDRPQLVSHEFLHLMGQDDEGGEYYDPKGRMAYKANYDNDYKMNNISSGDVENIINYAGNFGSKNPLKMDGKKDKLGAQVIILKEVGEGNSHLLGAAKGTTINKKTEEKK